MRVLSCFLVDDEAPALALLARFVKRTPGLVLSGQTTQPLEALAILPEAAPEVLLLDVDMPQLNGLELARLVPKLTAVIFTTSFREFGPEAFDQRAVDYLLKPIPYLRFLEAIQKVRERLPLAVCFVRTGAKGTLVRVDPAELVYVTGLSNYVELHFVSEKQVLYLSLKELLAQLPPGEFSRIHRSVIISHRYIRKVEADEVWLTNGQSFTLGDQYRHDFLAKLGRLRFNG